MATAGCRRRPVLDLSYSYLGAAGARRWLLLWLEVRHFHIYKGFILMGKVRQQLSNTGAFPRDGYELSDDNM